MIASGNKKNFLEAHWDWLVAGAGVALLAGAVGFMFVACSEDADETAAATLREIHGANRAETGVEPVDMVPFANAAREALQPPKLADAAETDGSFMGSEKRIFCEQGEDPEHKSCGAPIPANIKVCPFCQTKQPEEQKIVRDSDGDGIPDEWEAAHGMNANDPTDALADSDGDGFTNIEEFEAKPQTDPQDPASHPDYFDSLSLVLPLKKTVLPFYLEGATQIPGSWRLSFRSTKKGGPVFTARLGEEIGKDMGMKDAIATGFIAKTYTRKTKTQSIKGGTGMSREKDVSEAEVARKADGKLVRLVIGQRETPVEVQATLRYERGGTKEFQVVSGSEFELNGEKYKVVEIQNDAPNGVKVLVKQLESGKVKTLAALEQ